MNGTPLATILLLALVAWRAFVFVFPITSRQLPKRLRCALSGHRWEVWEPNEIARSMFLGPDKFCERCGRVHYPEEYYRG